MNRRIFFAYVLVICAFIGAFSGCGKSDDEDGGKDKKPSSSYREDNPGNTARIEIQIEDNSGNNSVQIPIFKSDLKSAEIDKINAEIQPVIDVYKSADANVLKWAEITTRSFKTDGYLQAVVEYQEMPSLDLDGNVVSFVYDRQKDKAISIAEALEMADYSDAQFGNLLNKLCDPDEVGGQLLRYDINGFYISKSGDVEFFVRLYINTGKDEYSLICTVVPGDKKLLTSNENGIQIIE